MPKGFQSVGHRLFLGRLLEAFLIILEFAAYLTSTLLLGLGVLNVADSLLQASVGSLENLASLLTGILQNLSALLLEI